jgi:hypothetical protein
MIDRSLVHRVLPVPQRWLDPDHPKYREAYGDFVAGGRYIRLTDDADITDMTVARAIIHVRDRPDLLISAQQALPLSSSDGQLIRVNLIKASVGWRWIDNPSNFRCESLCTIDVGGRHTYALEVYFASGVTLSRYADSRTEPRLRPSTYGTLNLGMIVGTIVLRKREHPVYERVIITGNGSG